MRGYSSHKQYLFAPSADTWVGVMILRVVDVGRNCRYEKLTQRRLLLSFSGTRLTTTALAFTEYESTSKSTGRLNPKADCHAFIVKVCSTFPDTGYRPITGSGSNDHYRIIVVPKMSQNPFE